MKKVSLTLAAGKLVLGPLLAAAIRDNKDAIRAAQEGTLHPLDMVDLTCSLALAAAQRVDPNMTLVEIENVVDIDNVGRVFAGCMGVSIPEPAPGEDLQAVSPST